MTIDVLLLDVCENDLPIFFEQQRDPIANQMAAFPARDRAAFMAHWTKILSDETNTIKTILADGHVVGNVVCWEQSGERLVGFWIGREYWGKGIATKALAKFLGHIKARPLYAWVAKHNIASIRVLEKCGFKISTEDKGSANVPGEKIEEVLMKLSASEREKAS